MESYNDYFNMPVEVELPAKPELKPAELPSVPAPCPCQAKHPYPYFPLTTHIQALPDDFKKLVMPVEVAHVSSLEEFKKALEDGYERITLSEDIVMEGENMVIADGNVLELNLNGHEIKAVECLDDMIGTLEVKDGAKVTIMNGTVSAEGNVFCAAIVANGGEINIVNGTFDGPEEGCAVYAHTADSKVVIEDGVFSAKSDYKGKWYVLNLKDKSGASIEVKGGTYYNYDPSASMSEDPTANFVAEGYEAVQVSEDPVMFAVRKAENAIEPEEPVVPEEPVEEDVYTLPNGLDVVIEGYDEMGHPMFTDDKGAKRFIQVSDNKELTFVFWEGTNRYELYTLDGKVSIGEEVELDD